MPRYYLGVIGHAHFLSYTYVFTILLLSIPFDDIHIAYVVEIVPLIHLLQIKYSVANLITCRTVWSQIVIFLGF
jgi:hypothetical protein